MKKVPKNNVDPVLVDVKRPDLNYKHTSQFSEVDLGKSSNRYKGKNSFSFGFLATSVISFGLLALLIGGGIAFSSLKSTKVTVETEGRQAAQNFFQSIESFKSLNPEAAGESLEKSKDNLENIQNSISQGPSKFAFNFLSSLVPIFKQAGGFLKELTSLNVQLIELSYNLENLKVNGFQYLRNDGEKLISNLKESRSIIRETISSISSLRNKSSSLDDFSDFSQFSDKIQNYHLNYTSNLYALEDFIGGMISLLSSDEEKRILLMFQNSSEIRPAGGFIGSYGEIVLENSQMKDLVVEDIYWPDHEMNYDLKLKAPLPLQRTVKNWAARDGNWFFDFPTSAETVMSLLESSRIYESKGIRFEGAVALNVEVLGTLLEVVGPVEIEEYGIEINHENFLPKLQEEVETGIDKQQGENPKKILSVVAPELMNRLEKLSEEQKELLVEKIGAHIEDKDVMFYSRDNNINSFLSSVGVDGSIYDIPENSWGSYLAVINANIAGGKTDIFTDQSINLRLDVLSDGSSVGELQIARENNGNKRSEPWYDTENKDYIKVLTPPGSELIFMEGNNKRPRYSEDYSSEYRYFKTLKPIEESRSYLSTYGVWETDEFGKKGFGTWLITPAGERNSMTLRYESSGSQDFKLEEGDTFNFVFDDQSGVDTTLDVEINAPVGYTWEESGSQIYTFSKENPIKREEVKLTIQEK